CDDIPNAVAITAQTNSPIGIQSGICRVEKSKIVARTSATNGTSSTADHSARARSAEKAASPYLFGSKTSDESAPSAPTVLDSRALPVDWVIALTSRPIPVWELPPWSRPFALGE